MSGGRADPLDRFLWAQARDYATALRELQQGRKRSHWIWYVLPQLRGLGRSTMAHEYGIANRQEARAYLDHPVLGARLRECITAILAHRSVPIERILGDIDALKFRSCLTLFAAVAPDEALFAEALRAFYGGVADERTLEMLDDDTA